MRISEFSTGLRILVVAGLITALAACATQSVRPGFYWGNYESSYYTLADNPGDRAMQQHLSTLRHVIEYSDARGMMPPPGAMLELAALEGQFGNRGAYMALVNREFHLYPESRPFIRRWFNDVMITPQVTPEDDNSSEVPTDDTQDESSDAPNSDEQAPEEALDAL